MHDENENEMHFRRARRGKAGEPLQLEATDRFQVAAVATVAGGKIIVVEDAIGTKLAAAFIPDMPAPREVAPPVAQPAAPVPVPAVQVAAPPAAPAASTWHALIAGGAIALAAAGAALGGQHLGAPAPVQDRCRR